MVKNGLQVGSGLPKDFIQPAVGPLAPPTPGTGATWAMVHAGGPVAHRHTVGLAWHSSWIDFLAAPTVVAPSNCCCQCPPLLDLALLPRHTGLSALHPLPSVPDGVGRWVGRWGLHEDWRGTCEGRACLAGRMG